MTEELRIRDEEFKIEKEELSIQIEENRIEEEALLIRHKEPMIQDIKDEETRIHMYNEMLRICIEEQRIETKELGKQVNEFRIEDEELWIPVEDDRIQEKKNTIEKKLQNIREERDKILVTDKATIARRRQLLEKRKIINWNEVSDLTACRSKFSSYSHAQLAGYVDARYSQAHIDYSDPSIIQHINDIEAFVDRITDALGEKYPVLRVRHRSNRGSLYKQTKVGKPDEADFILIPGISYDKSKVESRDTSQSHQTNSGRVTIKDPCIVNDLNNINRHITLMDGENVTCDGFVGLLLHAIEECTSGWPDVWKVEKHGPSVCVQARMPLCWLYIDLCFCFEESYTERGRCVLVPGKPYNIPIHNCDKCAYEFATHWTLSLCDIPPDSTRVHLDEPHRKLAVVLKSVFQTGSQYLLQRSTQSSHILTTFVETHQMTCAERQEEADIAECLKEVINHIIDVKESKCELPDIDFPKKDVVSNWKQSHFRNMITSTAHEIIMHLLNNIEEWEEVEETQGASVSVIDTVREMSPPTPSTPTKQDCDDSASENECCKKLK